jgi:drug/metabolite transporter (DMT)-like permease
MQGVYLCASYWAIGQGLAAGVMALLGALQPLFTALSAVLIFGAALGRKVWVGLVIGFLGVALVLAPKLAVGGPGSVSERNRRFPNVGLCDSSFMLGLRGQHG